MFILILIIVLKAYILDKIYILAVRMKLLVGKSKVIVKMHTFRQINSLLQSQLLELSSKDKYFFVLTHWHEYFMLCVTHSALRK